MADTIAIMGGEPFGEWIKRNGHAQRLYKAHHDKWPGGDARYAVIGDEFYVRSRNGGMRLVEYAGDFDDEGEWCAQCGTPIDPDGDAYYCCDVFECDAVLCDDCCEVTCGGCYCPRHRGNETLMDGKEDEYVYPYAFGSGDRFTFGVEIEIESEEFVENVTNSDIIAGWDNDPSLGRNGVEPQSNILDMSKLPALKHIVEDIPEHGENAGGHIHVARTPNQCASRWYWALRGLGASQCRLLDMRHMDEDYWCRLEHGAYTGKHTAVNDEHADTIELRTFDCWFTGSADKLVPAVKWVRAMWRFFEKHPRGTVGASSIEQYSSCMTDTPRRTLAERLDEAHRLKVARKAEEERERQERADEIRRRVKKNVTASRLARQSHGDTLPARLERRKHEERRERGRKRVEERLLADGLCYALPSRNLRPLRRYVQMATVMIEAGDKAPVLDFFHLYHAHNGDNIWNGYEYLDRHGDTATRVAKNIIRSRIARASHGKPVAEPLERTALRLLKRAGRPELSERYARIRKHIAAQRANA